MVDVGINPEDAMKAPNIPSSSTAIIKAVMDELKINISLGIYTCLTRPGLLIMLDRPIEVPFVKKSHKTIPRRRNKW